MKPAGSIHLITHWGRNRAGEQGGWVSGNGTSERLQNSLGKVWGWPSGGAEGREAAEISVGGQNFICWSSRGQKRAAEGVE